VTHPDRLVTQDELLDAAWLETSVTDAVLRVAIGALREVLGDTARTPRFIATVPRRGYRFLALVEAYTEEAAILVPASVRQHLAPPTDTLAPPEIERRRLTVLCCDLVDSTALSTHLDPEDLREVVRAYHRTCVEVVKRFDGYMAQYCGAAATSGSAEYVGDLG
jgi:class 3 adenylate cyclase